MIHRRKSKQQSNTIDTEICGFWKKAKNVFSALSSAWICQCQQHGAKLLLQHRTTGKAEFNMILTGFMPYDRESRKVRVSEGDDMVAARLKENIMLLESAPIHQPRHKRQKQSHPNISALRMDNAGTSTKLQKFVPRPKHLLFLCFFLLLLFF